MGSNTGAGTAMMTQCSAKVTDLIILSFAVDLCPRHSVMQPCKGIVKKSCGMKEVLRLIEEAFDHDDDIMTWGFHCKHHSCSSRTLRFFGTAENFGLKAQPIP